MEFSVGNVFSRTLSVIRERLGPLIGLWALYFGLTIAAVMVIGVLLAVVGVAGAGAMATFDENAGLGAFAGLGAGMIIVMILLYAGLLYLYAAQSCSFAAMGAPYERTLFGDAMSRGFKAGIPILGVMVVLLIFYIIFALVFGLLTAALGSASEILGIVAIVLFLPALIYIGCRLSIMVPVAANEQIRNPIKIITRSWELSQGHVLQIFGIMVLYLLGVGVAGLLLFGPIFALADIGGTEPGVLVILYLFVAYFVFLILLTVSQGVIVSVIHGLLSGNTGEDLGDVFE